MDSRIMEALYCIVHGLPWEHRTTAKTIAAHLQALLTAELEPIDALPPACSRCGDPIRVGICENCLTADPEPCEDAREPGELIIQGDCPCCGNPLKVMVGDDEGEVTVLGLDSKGVVRETFWQETKRDAYGTMVADKRAKALRAQVDDLAKALTTKMMKVEGLLEIIKEWRKGCSSAPSNHPELCPECTRAAIDTLQRKIHEANMDAAKELALAATEPKP